jgi:hypothetical protein
MQNPEYEGVVAWYFGHSFSVDSADESQFNANFYSLIAKSSAQ